MGDSESRGCAKVLIECCVHHGSPWSGTASHALVHGLEHEWIWTAIDEFLRPLHMCLSCARTLTRTWQTFVAWVHPNAGWRSAAGDPVSREGFLALLNSGGVGSEPRLRLRGDGVRMTATLIAELDSGGGSGASSVPEDYTEIAWVRTFAAIAADAAVSVETVSGAAQVPTALEEPLTVRVTIEKTVADVEHVVRPKLLSREVLGLNSYPMLIADCPTMKWQSSDLRDSHRTSADCWHPDTLD